MKPLTLLALLCLAVAACKKHDNSPPQYQLTLVSGGNQSGITGDTLPQQLVFKATENGQALYNANVLFETFDCDSNLLTTIQGIGYSIQFPMRPPLVTTYRWSLSGIVGTQTLKAVLLDSNGIRRDSVETTATVAQPGKGWNLGGCIPTNTFCVTFCQLPSGRMLTALHQAGYPYYSDDFGATWHALKTAPAGLTIRTLIATPKNEVFMACDGEGNYYSPDGGQTWTARNTGLPANSQLGHLAYTRSGQLFTWDNETGVYLSEDEGQFWRLTRGLTYYNDLIDVCSMSNGTLVAIDGNSMVRSGDGGQTWMALNPSFGFQNVSSILVDDKDNIYAGGVLQFNGAVGIYQSRDTGQTWNMVYTEPAPATNFELQISDITEQNGEYYFYSSTENNLIKTSDFSTFINIDPPAPFDNGRISDHYLVTSDNHIVAGAEFTGTWYFIP